MNKRKINIVLALVVFISSLFSTAGFGQGFEVKDDIELLIDSSTNNPTNEDILLNIIAIDEGSGIREIILPDRTKVTEENTTYTVTQNGNYTFKAIDNAGNETEETITITNIDKVPPVITVEPYETNWTNQDITVKAAVDKGTLNQESYTFTENGSFTFIATDEAGNKTEETVTITNIDKTLPAEGTINIIAVNEEGRNIKTITKEKLKLGVQVITAPNILGYKLISTPVVTIWLKPADNVKQVRFTYELDTDWEGWEETEKKVEEAEKKVKEAENNPIEKNKEEAQKKLEEAKKVVEKLPESEGKDKLNKKLNELQDRLNKIVVPREDPSYGDWEKANKKIEEAENKVKEAGNNPTEKNKEEAQKKLDKAKEVVEKLPESEEKDKLNKKLDELQDKINKVVIPSEDSSSHNDAKDISKLKLKEPEIKDISLGEFVARWKGHEVVSEEPIMIKEKSKAVLKIDEKQLSKIDKKGLSPRFYKWNEEKSKWVALATKIDETKIKTYEDVEGYVAVFAVKQPIFSDIKGNEWFAEIADRANGLALVEGYTEENGDTTLKPNNTISRSEFYTVTARLFGALQEGDNTLYDVLELKSIDESEEILSSTDYKVLNWAKPYTAALYEKGIIKELKGQTDLKTDITRIEAMDLLTKLLKKVEDIETIDLNKFKDVNQIEKYQELSGEKVQIADIVKGYEDKTLRPNDNMTRIEALTLIINSLEKLGW